MIIIMLYYDIKITLRSTKKIKKTIKKVNN